MPFSEEPQYDKIITNDSTSFFLYKLNKKIYDQTKYVMSWHEQVEIKYIISGSVNIEIGTEVFSAQPGDIVIVNPYEYHTTRVVSGKEAVYHLLCVDISKYTVGSFFDKYFAPYTSGEFRFRNLIRNDPTVKDAVLELFSSFEGEGDPLMSWGIFIKLFSLLCQRSKDDSVALTVSDKYSMRKRELVQTALSHIHTNFQNQIKIGDIAQKCYMSEAHFCRVFKQLTGDTPVSYINKYRINKAAVLLTDSSLSIKESAARVGFHDETYFLKSFKKYKGMSPSAYISRQEELKKQAQKPTGSFSQELSARLEDTINVQNTRTEVDNEPFL
ncbi:MAG: helix-turn-helix transcriptional regulator [Clostridia bacterium]|nr:helix-turn-helix transcriptional regulator [Clostridia bacterium]